MRRIFVPPHLLQTTLLTDEEKYRLVQAGYNGWIRMTENELANTPAGRALKHLKRLRLISIKQLPLGMYHCVVQWNKNEQWVECCLTRLGSHIFEKYRTILLSYDKKPAPTE
jgi:hypothetical protein